MADVGDVRCADPDAVRLRRTAICKRRTRAASACSASPWACHGKVFFLSEEGQTFVVAAGETFKLLHVHPDAGRRAGRRRDTAIAPGATADIDPWVTA